MAATDFLSLTQERAKKAAQLRNLTNTSPEKLHAVATFGQISAVSFPSAIKEFVPATD